LASSAVASANSAAPVAASAGAGLKDVAFDIAFDGAKVDVTKQSVVIAIVLEIIAILGKPHTPAGMTVAAEVAAV
jgi:hypothetical protein